MKTGFLFFFFFFFFVVADHLLVGQLCTNPKSDRSLLSCLKVTQCSTSEIGDAPLYNSCSLPIQVMTTGQQKLRYIYIYIYIYITSGKKNALRIYLHIHMHYIPLTHPHTIIHNYNPHKNILTHTSTHTHTHTNLLTHKVSYKIPTVFDCIFRFSIHFILLTA